MIWNRDRFVVWIISIWVFGVFPIWLALILWFVSFLFLKYIVLKKDIVYIYNLVNDHSSTDIICGSFGECIKKLTNKTTSDLNISKCTFRNEFSFSEYTNTLIVVLVYYLFGIVKLYPEKPMSFVIGIYLVAFSIFVLVARCVYTILNQKGNFFEKGFQDFQKLFSKEKVFSIKAFEDA